MQQGQKRPEATDSAGKPLYQSTQQGHKHH
jgi:hypothetical protein